jgi:hypothetical protein
VLAAAVAASAAVAVAAVGGVASTGFGRRQLSPALAVLAVVAAMPGAAYALSMLPGAGWWR